MTIEPVFTARGTQYLDLEKCLIDLLHRDLSAYARHKGYTLQHIAYNLNLKHEMNRDDDEVLALLEKLEGDKLAKRTNTAGGDLWSLRGYPPFVQKRQNVPASKKYNGRVKYTTKGQAKVTVPMALVEKIGKPSSVTFEMSQNQTNACIIIRPSFDNIYQI